MTMPAQAPIASDPLDVLEQALQAERRALLAHDVDALLASTQAKLAALRRVEAQPPAADGPARVSALNELNRANGVLLARRRREIGWALRHMGRMESVGVYDAGGRTSARLHERHLGIG